MRKLAAKARNKVKDLTAARLGKEELEQRGIGREFLLVLWLSSSSASHSTQQPDGAIGLPKGAQCPDQLFIEYMQLTDS